MATDRCTIYEEGDNYIILSVENSPQQIEYTVINNKNIDVFYFSFPQATVKMVSGTTVTFHCDEQVAAQFRKWMTS